MLHYGLAPDTFKLVYGNAGKFRPGLPDGMPKTLSLCGGGNMTVAFQLVLCADEPWALNVGSSLWVSQREGVETIRVAAPKGVSLSIEELHEDDDRFFRADALLTQEVTEQDAGMPRAVYCELALPTGAEPGERTLTLPLFSSRFPEDERKCGEVSVTVNVFPYSLPNMRDSRFHLDLWQHLSNIARKHGTPLWSDEHFRVLEPYVASLAALGQKAVTLVVSEVPWCGQGCTDEFRMKANLFEYSIVPLTRKTDGTLEADFLPMQRYIDLCAAYGIRKELSVYGLMNVWSSEKGRFSRIVPDDPDTLRVRVYDEASGSYGFLRTEAELETYILLLADYFRKTGQIDRVRIAADEPADAVKYRACLERMKRLAPDFRYKAAINHAEFIADFGEDISDFVPFSSHLFKQRALLRELRRRMPEKRFLWYVCCYPDWPNTFLGSDLCETLLIGPITSLCRMDGFLRWNYTVWNDDPVKDVRYGNFRAGDTNFVYPSPAGKPLLTLRWKALRRSVRLYELLEAYRAKYGDEKTDALIGTVLLKTETERFYEEGYSGRDVVCTDPEAWESLQKTLLEGLSLTE